ncbi:neuroglobin-like isoform X2 [Argopecten irradians]|uniref:neuroglobin-like isoform X2 n=1 Tax=Argopecten irradians TaxID=31199 RepID=UPI00371F3456
MLKCCCYLALSVFKWYVPHSLTIATHPLKLPDTIPRRDDTPIAHTTYYITISDLQYGHIPLYIEYLARLFKSNADLMAIFEKFTNIQSEDELRQNEYLEQHATLVMTTLDDAISRIDDYDYVKGHLHRTGATHQRFDVFRPENFWKIREPFIEAVKITLGDRYTEYMSNVYEITIDFILKSLEDGFLDNNNPVEQKIIVTDHSKEQPEVTKIEHCCVRENDVTNKEEEKT